MNLLDAIESRRSIRRFSESPIEESTLFKVLHLASFAPSASDARPWRFVILTDRNKLQEAARINPFGQMADKAACGVLVAGDLLREKQSGFWVQDCAACTTTMLLAAHGLGLGAVWTGIYPVKQRVNQFRELVDAPQSIIPFSLVLLGYSEQRAQPATSRLDLREVYYNTFGNTRFPSVE
ncbi:MAG: nitroreductase family protein [Deltaproteobacteria bacterium]|nr:nitroreductase family protein [Deltaproteobacteria bacterium]